MVPGWKDNIVLNICKEVTFSLGRYFEINHTTTYCDKYKKIAWFLIIYSYIIIEQTQYI